MDYVADIGQIPVHRFSRDVVDALRDLGSVAYDGDRDNDAVVIPYSGGLINSLRKRYAFKDEAAVRDFLETYPFLIQVLFRADREIRKIFGAAPRLVLRVVPDPEGEGEGELFLFIQTERHPQAARALLGELRQAWWLDAMLDAKGEMSISLEYV